MRAQHINSDGNARGRLERRGEVWKEGEEKGGWGRRRRKKREKKSGGFSTEKKSSMEENSGIGMV